MLGDDQRYHSDQIHCTHNILPMLILAEIREILFYF